MMKTTEELLEQAKRLPLEERAALVDALLSTIDPGDSEYDSQWTDEAESRLRAYRAGDLPAIDASEVLDNRRR